MENRFIFSKSFELEKYFNYVYSPRCESFAKFDFANDCILNRSNKNVLDGFDYVSIVQKDKVCSPVELTTQCEFEKFGAPLIVIAKEIFINNGKFIYGEHIEVVAYEEGINVWHIIPDEKEVVKVSLLGEKKFLVEEKQKFSLSVKINGSTLIANIGENSLKVNFDFDNEFFAGVTACEGINRFYDFIVKKGD